MASILSPLCEDPPHRAEAALVSREGAVIFPPTLRAAVPTRVSFCVWYRPGLQASLSGKVTVPPVVHTWVDLSLPH